MLLCRERARGSNTSKCSKERAESEDEIERSEVFSRYPLKNHELFEGGRTSTPRLSIRAIEIRPEATLKSYNIRKLARCYIVDDSLRCGEEMVLLDLRIKSSKALSWFFNRLQAVEFFPNEFCFIQLVFYSYLQRQMQLPPFLA